MQEPVFGPLVVFGLGGVATEVLGDHIARLSPLTDADADEMISGVRAAPLLHRAPRLGPRSTPPGWPTSCCGCPGSRPTCRRSPSWTSTR